MFVNPHNDDAVIGAGGLLMQLISAGWDIMYFQVSNGGRGSKKIPYKELVEIRAEEGRKERDALGVKYFHDFGLSGADLDRNYLGMKPDLVDRMATQIDKFDPDAIFIPAEFEDHNTHKITYDLSISALEEATVKPAQLRYSVWFMPFRNVTVNHFDEIIAVDISNQVERKHDIIKNIHISQEEKNYSYFIEGFNRFLAIHSRYEEPIWNAAEVFAVTNTHGIRGEKYKLLTDSLQRYKVVTRTEHGSKFQPPK